MKAPTMQSLDVPKEHLPMLLNIAISEAVLGFERRVIDGRHEWRGKRTDGTYSEWDDALPGFSTSLDESMHVLQQILRQLSLGLNIIYNPVRDSHAVVVLNIEPDGKNVTPKMNLSGRPLPELLAAAICQVMNIDLIELHKQCYPGHYIMNLSS